MQFNHSSTEVAVEFRCNRHLEIQIGFLRYLTALAHHNAAVQ